jgi:predicted deacylase
MSVTRIPVTTLASGGDLAIWLHEYAGTGDGPTLGLCAAIHGDEAVSVEILWRFAQRLRALSFKGRILMLPVANPLALEGRSRHSPLDMQNMNRVFPGDPSGWVTEQLADAVTRNFLERIDVLVDLHAGGYYPTVDYVYITNAEHLSRAFGSPLLYRPQPGKAGTVFGGTSTGVTRERNVPSVTVELGGGDVDQSAYVARGLNGIANIMHVLGMLDGPPAPRPRQTVVHEIVTVRPSHGGLLIPAAPPLGEPIAGGSELGRVVSPYTLETLEVIQNPVAQGVMILSHLTVDVVQPGDYGYMVGNLADAEIEEAAR